VHMRVKNRYYASMNKHLWQSNVNNTATKEYMNLLHSVREGILGHVI